MAVTASFTYAASQLSIRTNIEDLFPENTPRVTRAKAARDKLARSSQILLVVSSPDKEANEKFVNDLSARLEAEDLIDTVDLKHDVSFFKRNALLFLPPEELESIDARLKRSIKKAVAKDLDPFNSGGAEGLADDSDDNLDEDFGGSDGELDEDFGGRDGELDEDFGDEEEVDEGFGAPPDSDPEEAICSPSESGEDCGAAEAGGLRLPDENEIREKYGVATLSEYLSNSEGTLYGIKAFPTFSASKVGQSKKLLSRIETIVSELDPSSYHPEMEWIMEGDYHKKIEEIAIIRSDLSRASLFALGVILILVALYFGNLRGVLFVFVPLLSGLAWTMGMAWLTVGYLNLITAFIFAIMFGLGVDFAVHAVNRYMEGREQGKEVEEALVDGLMHLGRPMISAAITTTITFLSLVIFDFRGFSQFGLIAGLGVPICLFVVYLIFPPLTVILHRIHPEKPARKRRFSGNSENLFFGSRRKALVVIAGFLGAVLLLSPGVSRVGFEQDMKKVMTKAKETDRSRLMHRFRREVEGRSTSPVILLTESREETRKVHDFLDDHGGEYAYIQDYASIFSFVPDDQNERKEIVDRMHERLRKKMGALEGEDLTNAEEAMPYLTPEVFGELDLPDWVLAKFTDKDGNIGHFVTLYAHGHKAHAADVGRILEELDPLVIDGKSYPTTASYYILRDAYDIVLGEGPIAVGLAALAVLMLLFIDFRTLREVVAAFLPLFLGVVAYLGYMGWTGQDINMFNMVILPTVFGIGIDSSIHLVHRVREEGVNRMGLIANTTGSAAGMSAATTAIGFGSLALASNPGLRSIGVLAPVGIILCYLASVLLTCSLSTLWQRGSNR